MYVHAIDMLKDCVSPCLANEDITQNYQTSGKIYLRIYLIFNLLTEKLINFHQIIHH